MKSFSFSAFAILILGFSLAAQAGVDPNALAFCQTLRSRTTDTTAFCVRYIIGKSFDPAELNACASSSRNSPFYPENGLACLRSLKPIEGAVAFGCQVSYSETFSSHQFGSTHQNSGSSAKNVKGYGDTLLEACTEAIDLVPADRVSASFSDGSSVSNRVTRVLCEEKATQRIFPMNSDCSSR